MKAAVVAKKLREIGELEMAGLVESQAVVIGYLKRGIAKDKQEMECGGTCRDCETDCCPNRELIDFMVDAGIEL